MQTISRKNGKKKNLLLLRWEEAESPAPFYQQCQSAAGLSPTTAPDTTSVPHGAAVDDGCEAVRGQLCPCLHF